MTQKTKTSCTYWSPLYPGKLVLKSKGRSIWISNICNYLTWLKLQECKWFSWFWNRKNSSNALLFWNPLVMASTATEYFQLTAILFIFEFVSICYIEFSNCKQHWLYFIVFQKITLSKSLIYQQHKMYPKMPQKNTVSKQHKILEYQKGWSFFGHFLVI